MISAGLTLATISGLVAMVGLTVMVVGLRRRPVRLDDAMAHLTAIPEDVVTRPTIPAGVEVGDRLGAWVLRRTQVPVSSRTRRLLALQRRSLVDFAAEKAAFAGIGLGAPLFFLAISAIVQLPVGPLPALLGVVGGVIGWFVPDLRLRRAAPAVQADAGEALCTYVDLVALERLANQSSTQALTHAAAVCDHPLFTALRVALDRARLEQRPSWQALREVGEQLDLPQLVELGDLMRLDEHGAALSGVLRSRADELRDAHLLTEKVAAQQVSESMTIWMVVPAMVFGLIFLAPPLLRLLAT